MNDSLANDSRNDLLARFQFKATTGSCMKMDVSVYRERGNRALVIGL